MQVASRRFAAADWERFFESLSASKSLTAIDLTLNNITAPLSLLCGPLVKKLRWIICVKHFWAYQIAWKLVRCATCRSRPSWSP